MFYDPEIIIKYIGLSGKFARFLIDGIGICLNTAQLYETNVNILKSDVADIFRKKD